MTDSQPAGPSEMDALAVGEPQYVVEPLAQSPGHTPAGALDAGPQPDPDAQTAPTVLAAVGFGFVPVPFLSLYALLFLLHGLLVPVQPPDITSSRGGEALAGVVALVLLVLLCCTLVWFVGRRRRWPFAVGQLVVLASAVYFLADSNSGPPLLPAVLVITSVVALALAFAPASWAHLGQTPPDLTAARARLARLRRRPTDDQTLPDSDGGMGAAGPAGNP